MIPPLVLSCERAALTTTLLTCHYQKLTVPLIELKQISLAAKPIKSTETVEFRQNILETSSEQIEEGLSLMRPPFKTETAIFLTLIYTSAREIPTL